MPEDSRSNLETLVAGLLKHSEQTAILARIEGLLWLIAALLAAVTLLAFLNYRRARTAASAAGDDWQSEVETAYEKGDYDTALNVLETARLLYPASASIGYWQGRCYFQMKEWEKAASCFETLLRQEPIYRRSVKDYLAFIELNDLAPGVEGYSSEDERD